MFENTISGKRPLRNPPIYMGFCLVQLRIASSSFFASALPRGVSTREVVDSDLEIPMR